MQKGGKLVLFSRQSGFNKAFAGAALIVMLTLSPFIYKQKLSASIVKPSQAYSFIELEEDLSALSERFPQSLRVIEYGVSREGRSLYAAIAGDESAKYAVIIQAGIHGREHMTTCLVMAELERLLRKGVPKNVCFFMLPATNPDGAYISQTASPTPLAKGIYQADKTAHRYKDEADYYTKWKSNAAGVDLNRNFDALWDNILNSSAPSNENYKGPYPLSEPETQALVKLTQSRKFDVTISYHATGSEIYYAFYTDEIVNDLGLSLAKKLNERLKYDIKPDSGKSFGGYKDMAIMKEKIPSLTIEIGKGAAPLPMSEWKSIWKKHSDIPYDIAEWLLQD